MFYFSYCMLEFHIWLFTCHRLAGVLNVGCFACCFRVYVVVYVCMYVYVLCSCVFSLRETMFFFIVDLRLWFFLIIEPLPSDPDPFP